MKYASTAKKILSAGMAIAIGFSVYTSNVYAYTDTSATATVATYNAQSTTPIKSVKGGKWVKRSGKWYYKKSGKYIKGFAKIDRKVYYFNKKGVMATGLKKIDVYYYFFSDDGVMQTGWLEYKGEKYYFESKGYAACGWKQIDGDYYYFADNGQMIHDTYVDDDLYVGSDGRLVGEVIPPIPEDGTWQDDKIDDVIIKLNELRKERVIRGRFATWYVPLKAHSGPLSQAKQECLNYSDCEDLKAVISGNASVSQIVSKLSRLVDWNNHAKCQWVNIGIAIYYKDGKTYVVAIFTKGPSGTGIPVELPDPS